MALATRPGIVTAAGIFSIILGSLGLLVNGYGMLIVGMVIPHFIGAARPTVVAAPAPPPPPSGEYVAPDGFSSSQRGIIIAGLSRVQPLSEARAKQLNGLLADAGRKVIRLNPENLTPDRIAAYVTEVKQMPNDSGGPPDDVFVLGSGRLQLADQNAVFFPQDSPSGIRSEGGSFTDSLGTHLASNQIGAVVDRAQALCNQAMNNAQVNALRANLQQTTQTLLTPSASTAQAAAQVRSAQVLEDNTVAITTDGGSISLGPTGQTWQGVSVQPNFTPPRVARIDATLLTLETILSLIAAACLLTIGILTLRNSHRARQLHVVYAVGKALLAGLSCYAIFRIVQQLDAGSPDAQSVALAWMLIVGATGLIYPAVLLIVMNLPGVREFFAAPVLKRFS